MRTYGSVTFLFRRTVACSSSQHRLIALRIIISAMYDEHLLNASPFRDSLILLHLSVRGSLCFLVKKANIFFWLFRVADELQLILSVQIRFLGPWWSTSNPSSRVLHFYLLWKHHKSSKHVSTGAMFFRTTCTAVFGLQPEAALYISIMYLPALQLWADQSMTNAGYLQPTHWQN